MTENRARAIYKPERLIVTQHEDGRETISEWPTCAEFGTDFLAHADRSQIKVDAGYIVIELSNGMHIH